MDATSQQDLCRGKRRRSGSIKVASENYVCGRGTVPAVWAAAGEASWPNEWIMDPTEVARFDDPTREATETSSDVRIAQAVRAIRKPPNLYCVGHTPDGSQTERVMTYCDLYPCANPDAGHAARACHPKKVTQSRHKGLFAPHETTGARWH